MSRAYGEIIDFIAAGTTPRSVSVFQPSEATRTQVAELIRREKTELDHYLQLEHVMRLAKTRARQRSLHTRRLLAARSDRHR